jgi:hypothetical protein
VIALIVAASLLVGLMLFMWISVGREPGPGPADVALAYERAWSDLDFDLLFDLSGEELRDGMRRDVFIAAKRAAYASPQAQVRLRSEIEVETVVAGHQAGLVVTRVEAPGECVRNNVMVEKRANGWVVVGYSLRPDTEGGTTAS